MSFINNFKKALDNSGLSHPSIVINGKPFTRNGRMVYVHLIQNKAEDVNLEFYTRIYNKNVGRSTNEVLYDAMPSILAELNGNEFFGCVMPIAQDEENAKIIVNSEYDLIIIESEFYSLGKRLQSIETRSTVTIHNYELTEQLVQQLKNNFFQMALISYRDIVYTPRLTKYVSHLVKSNRLMNIKPVAFIPVFTDVEWLYNPFNRSDLKGLISNTVMYKTAVEKGRFIKNGDASAYFLTHLEICKAFDMSYFARFDSAMWYNLFCGLLFPQNVVFPNKNTKAIIWASEGQIPDELKRVYSPQEFVTVREKYGEKYREELESYSVENSLNAYVMDRAISLKSIGPTYLDSKSKVTATALCSYYNTASLRMG